MPSLLTGKVAIAHLLRRAGFGPHAATWNGWAKLDYDTAVDRVLADLDTPLAKDPEPFDLWNPGTIQSLWIDRMVKAPIGAAEKLAFFWHGHFATSESKIIDIQLMWTQYKMLRTKGAGSFRDLVLAISKDVAMIRWLDGNSNRSGHANENYGRELQELFTLGIGNYTEKDIREVARAFTGWGSRSHDFVFKKHFHDTGTKTIHGKTGNFGGEEVVDLLVSLPACSRFIAGKLLRFYSHPDPSKDEVEALAKVMRDSKLDTKTTLGALWRSESFRARSRHRALVKSPIEFSVGACRALGTSAVPGWLQGSTDRMGQTLFRPPSVKGWTSGKGWLSSGSVVERLKAAQRLASHTAKARAASPPRQPLADLLDVALQGVMPKELSEVLGGLSGAARDAVVLGGPEFQLG